jgi:hypothetical protein
LLVDPAIPTYTAGELRDVSRSAASHNGPHMAGVEPIEFWKSFRVGRRGKASEILSESLTKFAPIWCAGRHDGYAHVGVETRRFIALWPGEAFLVCDLMQGNFTTDCASNFLVPQAWEQAASATLSFSQMGNVVSIKALIGELSIKEAGRYWPRFGVETPAHLFSMSPAENGDRRQSALWLSWSDTATPPNAESLSGLFDRLSAC